MYVCYECKKEFDNIYGFTGHLRNHGLTSKAYYDKYLKKDGEGICPVCGKSTKYLNITSGYSKHCSSKCSGADENTSKKRSDTNLDKFGVKSPSTIPEIKGKICKTKELRYGDKNYNNRDKYRETCIDRFGCESSSKSDAVKEKARQTNLSKYGTEFVFQSDEIKDKIRNTVLDKYGVDNVSKAEEIKEKIQKSNNEKYNVPYPMQSPDIRNKRAENNIIKYGVSNPASTNDVIQKKIDTVRDKYGVDCVLRLQEVRDKAKITSIEKYGVEYPSQADEVKDKVVETNLSRYGVPYFCMTDSCRLSNGNESNVNLYIYNKLLSYGLDVTREFPIGSYQYDFKIGNDLLEINPTITHNININPFGGKPKDKMYHMNKSSTAREHGYRCIHVWDWDSIDDIIKQLLTKKETVYARNCSVVIVEDFSSVNEFICRNHLQGNVKYDIAVGLLYNNELISVMTFGKPRYNKNYQYELLRYCSSHNVIGGAEKIFKFFVKEVNPESVISYCDLSKFNGAVYNRLGFTQKEVPKPSKHWYNPKTKRHITDNLLRQRGFDQILGKEYGCFGKGTSNEELMLSHGFFELYDCGQATYTITFERK